MNVENIIGVLALAITLGAFVAVIGSKFDD